MTGSYRHKISTKTPKDSDYRKRISIRGPALMFSTTTTTFLPNARLSVGLAVANEYLSLLQKVCPRSSSAVASPRLHKLSDR